MKKILCVIDMQNDFVTGSLANPRAENIIPNIVVKIEEAKNNGDYIILTQDTHSFDYLNTQEGKYLPVEHCIHGTDGWEIINEIKKIEIKNILQKETFGSIDFGNILKDYCYENKVEEIEFCGLVSSICVVSNALIVKAFLPEMKITVDAQCIEGLSDEDYKASICVMKMCQIQVINDD